MFDARQVFGLGYPYGVAIYEVTYTWQNLPDSVKNGEEYDMDYVTRSVEKLLGRGEWIVFPILHEGVWCGLYAAKHTELVGHDSISTAPPCETLIDEQ